MNGRYSSGAEVEVKNCHGKIYLCNIKNLYDTLIKINNMIIEKELEIKKTVEKNKNSESFIILIKVSYLLKSNSLIYKIDDSYIKFNKNKKNFNSDILERLNFDFDNECLQKIYNGSIDIKIN